ncbi:MAG: competence/damage-inducible protein A [Elusimicrobia bacterium]|nr:competence/damage-inducible protein A [Elusimicrobiota bacterium]
MRPQRRTRRREEVVAPRGRNPSPRLEVLCVGTELLAGRINTHMALLAPGLLGAAFPIARETTVADSVAEIRDAATAALERSDMLLVTGGLGPTFDDLTREGIAEALGVRMAYQPELFRAIARRFRRYGRRVPEENKRQAYVLEGAAVLPNAVGSAPGQRIDSGGKTVFLLPGPASEMRPMFEGHVLPFLRRRAGGRVACKTILHLASIPESSADELLAPLYRSAERRGVEFTILSPPGLVDLHVTATARSEREARRRLSEAAAAARRLVGRWVFGAGDETLESVAGDRLARRGWTLATAESCTGGEVSRRLTSVPGSSRYFLGGVVCYADTAKLRELGVPGDVLKRHGAVSQACARAMARGAQERWGADCALAITGIAGPGGGTPAKPVGLVYLACAAPGGRVKVQRWNIPGDRDAVRRRASIAALTLLLRSLVPDPSACGEELLGI